MRFINQFMGWVLRQSYDMVNAVLPGDSNIVSNYAIAILILAVVIKIITIPLTMKSSKATAKTRLLQPRLQEIQKKYGNDKQTVARKQQELYQEAGVNPMGGCLPMLIQFPIIIAMWNVVRDPHLYAFTEPGFYEAMNKSFFWISNLNDIDTTMILPILAAAVSYVNTKIMTKSTQASTGNAEQDKAMQQSNNMMQIMMPAMLLMFYRAVPAVLPLYMIISMVLSTVVQLIVNKQIERELEQEGEQTK